VAAAVRRELARPEIRQYLRPELSVAIGVGSRALASMPVLVAAAVSFLRETGCHPFIVPAMGSHGGATVEGQRQLLAGYGITEESVGAPIRSSMEVVEIGRLGNNLPLYFDRLALQADLVIPLNRIKPHTAFRGAVESGLLKMLAIGLGKHAGAQSLHRDGFPHLSQHLCEAYPILCQQVPFRFGLATVENAREEVAHVEAIAAEALLPREAALLQSARQWMARLRFEQLDVLVVGYLGKNVSGSGMDPNVTGRFASGIQGDIAIGKIAVLNLTPETHGNALGLGMADVTTERVVRKMDLDSTWINAFTSTVLPGTRIPIFMPDDRMAIQFALRTCNQVDPQQVRMICIRNTLELETIAVSEALWGEMGGRPEYERLSEAEFMPFDPDGRLIL
jgi:hypothetical protein